MNVRWYARCHAGGMLSERDTSFEPENYLTPIEILQLFFKILDRNPLNWVRIYIFSFRKQTYTLYTLPNEEDFQMPSKNPVIADVMALLHRARYVHAHQAIESVMQSDCHLSPWLGEVCKARILRNCIQVLRLKCLVYCSAHNSKLTIELSDILLQSRLRFATATVALSQCFMSKNTLPSQYITSIMARMEGRHSQVWE